MKVYYYAFTGHKFGLDRMKRGAVVLNKLRENGIDTMLLVNDFRAGLVARDFGVPESITIEGIQDIDAIAEIGDSVIIDSPEDDHGRLVKYCSDFKAVFRFSEHDGDKSIHGETMLRVNCDSDECISSILVDDVYFESHKKEDRTLFFLSDSDANKLIINNADFFKDSNMELLLGNYFYIKYEDDLAKIFDTLHEPEEYQELICSSSHIVTASFQTALEAVVAGAKVTYLELNNLTIAEKELFKLLDVIIIIGFNKESYEEIDKEKKLNVSFKEKLKFYKNDGIIAKLLEKL
jgi:hypothetical protein